MSSSPVPPSNGSPAPDEPGDHLSVAIVDDHPPIREALRSRAEGHIGTGVVGEASSSEGAFRLIEEQRPGVAILDLSLQDGQSFELIEDLRAECPETSLLVFSVHDETVYAERVLRAGASGYVMKPAGSEEVLKAARHVAENGVYLSPDMTMRVLRHVQKGPGQEAHFPIDELTARELEVFKMIGQGLAVDVIADRLGIARKTAETHRRQAKVKLGYETIHQVVSHAARWMQAEGHRDPAQSAC